MTWASGTALVTGASGGIGEVYARRLHAAGQDVVLVARRASRLDALAGDLRTSGTGRVETLVADLAGPEGRAAVAERAAGRDVSLLVNNAGLSGYGPFAEAEPEVLEQVVSLNVLALTLLSRAAVPAMLARGSGAVVNVASLLAFSGALPPGPLPHRATYAGTKAFVVAFSRTLAEELRGTGVTVQACCPGYTSTEFHLTSGTEPVPDEALLARGDEPGAMSAEDVVTASLAALRTGEVVCAPGLNDPTAVDRLTAAEAELRRASRPQLAARYREPADDRARWAAGRDRPARPVV
ncbi:SDR family NAD(P)-dependent oxidoreductase [Motilibacter deserti]|uniref:SDR family NAD(P)-dependent oxidoreductase n=1 Tax=Motilibacter deserti TaxID=2714956 RepID=A0ABX0GX03_9ACTN|nr:SDR family NAD(P)-dependent oxidoreductase [Motilibacter deserti]NHC14631.1 SDR family NAD(P)-dependent oxidoreductase [Motilibacter deserti]